VKAERGWHQSVTGVARRTFEAAFEDNIPFLASALSFDLLLTCWSRTTCLSFAHVPPKPASGFLLIPARVIVVAGAI